MQLREGKINVSVKEAIGAVIVLVVLAFVVGTALVYVSHINGYDDGYSVGVDRGTGMLSPAMVGEVYELTLVGKKGGRYHDVEVTYGYQKDNQPIYKEIPCGAKAGDSVTCIRPDDDLVVIPGS